MQNEDRKHAKGARRRLVNASHNINVVIGLNGLNERASNGYPDYSAFANSCPLQTDTFLFPLIHNHNVILSSNKF